MLRRCQPVAIAALVVSLAAAPAGARTELPDIVEELTRSVVLIWFQDAETGFTSYGTGFVIDGKGHVLTCAHVVADRIRVTVAIPTEGAELNYPATIVAIDPRVDSAILRIDATDLPPIAFGSSADVRAGEEVGFVGFPLGYTVESTLGPSLTMGYVASVRPWRVVPSGPPLPMIQIDGNVTIGTSGSPLFRRDTGEVIGMMKSHVRTPGPVLSKEDVLGEIQSIPKEMALSAGIGLALPIDAIARFVEESGVDLGE